jgi:hypothetical protein
MRGMIARLGLVLAVMWLGLVPAAGRARAQATSAPKPQSLGKLFGGEPPRTAAGSPELDAIEAELRALGRRSDAAVARAAITRGLDAVEDARRESSAGHATAAERKQQIAWAALALAGRQLAAARAREARDVALRAALAAEHARAAAARELEVVRAGAATKNAPESRP